MCLIHALNSFFLSFFRPNHNNNNNITTNNNNNHLNKGFMKGSIIELANGEFKRVEDMRTEDFILSVKNSSKLELKDSTVVKITPTSNQVIVITFSFDKNRSQVCVYFTLRPRMFSHFVPSIKRLLLTKTGQTKHWKNAKSIRHNK